MTTMTTTATNTAIRQKCAALKTLNEWFCNNTIYFVKTESSLLEFPGFVLSQPVKCQVYRWLKKLKWRFLYTIVRNICSNSLKYEKGVLKLFCLLLWIKSLTLCVRIMSTVLPSELPHDKSAMVNGESAKITATIKWCHCLCGGEIWTQWVKSVSEDFSSGSCYLNFDEKMKWTGSTTS